MEGRSLIDTISLRGGMTWIAAFDFAQVILVPAADWMATVAEGR
jgi:hypothetical protein